MKFDDQFNPSNIVSIGQINLGAPGKELISDNDSVPILPTRNLVLFPGITIPISLGRANSLLTARLAAERKVMIGVLCQKNPDMENPYGPEDFYKYGVFAEVLKVIDLPDNTHTAIVHAHGKFRLIGFGDGLLIPEVDLSFSVKPVRDSLPRANDREFDLIIDQVKTNTLELLETTPGAPDDLTFNLRHATSPEMILNLVATHIPAKPDFKISLLSQHRLKERGLMLLSELSSARELSQITKSIIERTQSHISEQQRNTFLQNQMDAIRQELYGDNDDATKFMERAEKLSLSEEATVALNREVDKLRRLNPQSPDYSVQYAYLDTFLSLPWGKHDEENDDFDKAREILNDDHYGLEKVKDRILEQLAVIMNNREGNAPILCLAGAPGVGKTSLGHSIARAMGRRYQRVSLGGLHDEAEIRGHRRTYIGAMPGRIIDAIKRAGSSNPVILLDEIDKIGSDFKGDPAAALLEVLDPEQNCHFHDNYIDFDYDLSRVLFIATANTLSTISQPLLDRMEIIDIAGYLMEEKIEIATRHLIPRLLADNHLTPENITFTPEAISTIIERYTGESGVRQLEKQLASIVRKVILRRMSRQDYNPVITPDDVESYLGVPRYNRDRYEGNDYAGVVTGLAWTAVGGEILYIETSLSRGKGEKLVLTGNLGNVMKESAMIALQYVKAHADTLGVDYSLFEKYDFHIHVPEGAIPKDGPSAGITMVTSIVSALKQCRVNARFAMTGEITLRGKVLPVGGIKEKMLAAKRAGITDIILSADNRKDVEDILPKYRDGLTFHYVTAIPEVLALALSNEPAVDAITL